MSHIFPASINGLKGVEGSTVVMFGDSITQGHGVPEESTWVSQITRRFHLVSINAGVGGDTTSLALERLSRDVLSEYPDFVIINFGMNDHVMYKYNTPAVSLKDYAYNLVTMIDEIRRYHAIPVLVTTNYIIEGNPYSYYYNRHPQTYYSNVGGAEAWLEQYVRTVRDIATQKRVDLVDVYRACARYDKFMFLRSLMNEANTDDGVHPYIMGANVYAMEIGTYLAVHY